MEQELECKVIDRTMLILDIFARRARTSEARMQVELAKLQYMFPRLVGLRASLGRQGRRHWRRYPKQRGRGDEDWSSTVEKSKTRLQNYDGTMEHVKEQRETQRKQRKKSGIPVVSIVGYTNAGKSTLMNQLL